MPVAAVILTQFATAAQPLAEPVASAFKPFTLTHAVTSGTYTLLMIALVAAGLLWRNTPRQRTLETAWFAFVLLVQLFNIIFWCTPPRLELASSLPLHICDLAGVFAIFATRTWTRTSTQPNARDRTLATIMFFWGLGLSTQAFITPVITQGPDTVRFHIFFLSHFTIVATPLYDLIVRGYRPGLRDFSVILLVTAIFGAIMIPLNAATGWNYGYAGSTKPENPTVIDKLGPYPLRLLWMAGIVTTVYAVLTLIGHIIPRRSR
ncbi:MAG: TIGR02206 family membrane protein [Phycisphaerae bacterium]